MKKPNFFEQQKIKKKCGALNHVTPPVTNTWGNVVLWAYSFPFIEPKLILKQRLKLFIFIFKKDIVYL